MYKVENLLQEGANPDHDLFWTEEWKRYPYVFLPPLHCACMNGDLKIVKLLVENGANINRRGGHHNMPPLHYAPEGKKADVEYLMSKKEGSKVGKL